MRGAMLHFQCVNARVNKMQNAVPIALPLPND